MRLLQLSDPHLLADPAGLVRGRPPLAQLRQALRRAAALLEDPPDLLLISGDLCHDESWGGYVRLRELLEPLAWPVALLAGNHDHPQLLRAALGRRAGLAPRCMELGGVVVLLLDSHRPGWVGGWLGERQLAWIAGQLAELGDRPLVVAVHHPPGPIGDPGLDGIALADGEALLALLRPIAGLQAVLFGHVHQHWQAPLPGRPVALPPAWLLGCPSTLCGFGPVQPCPLGRPNDSGGRLLELAPGRPLRQQLLRWPAVPQRP
jgi:Icc protein